MKGLIVVCGFPQTPGPREEWLEGKLRSSYWITRQCRRKYPTLRFSNPQHLFTHKKSLRLGPIRNLHSTVLQGQVVLCECWVQLKWIKILSQKKQTLVSKKLLCL